MKEKNLMGIPGSTQKTEEITLCNCPELMKDTTLKQKNKCIQQIIAKNLLCADIGNLAITE